jgi:hypothetical protein
VVKAGQTTVQIRFDHLEADGDYAVFVEQTWLSNRAIAEKTAGGFTVKFSEAAPAAGKLDWMLVR